MTLVFENRSLSLFYLIEQEYFQVQTKRENCNERTHQKTYSLSPQPAMTQGEKRQKNPSKKSWRCLFTVLLSHQKKETSQLSLRRTPSDSGGRLVEVEATGASTTGRSSLLAHVLRPESTHAQIRHTQTQTQTQIPLVQNLEVEI